jgi:hypothetical protein
MKQHIQKKMCLDIRTGAAYQRNSAYIVFLPQTAVFGKFVVYQYQVHVLCLLRQGIFIFAFFMD